MILATCFQTHFVQTKKTGRTFTESRILDFDAKNSISLSHTFLIGEVHFTLRSSNLLNAEAMLNNQRKAWRSAYLAGSLSEARGLKSFPLSYGL